MDSAAKNLAALAAIATVFMAEGICGLIAYVFLPLLSGSHSFCLACLLPAIMLGGLLAALEHENYHVRNRDPLRSLIGTVLAEAVFLVPSLAVLQRRYEASRELAADQTAEHVCGRRSLIGALLKALEDPLWPDATASASLASPDLLSLRLARLESGRTPHLSIGGLPDLAWSVFGVGAFMACLAAAIVGVGGIPALSHAVTTELSPAGGAFETFCLAPVVGLTALVTLASARRSRGIAGSPAS